MTSKKGIIMLSFLDLATQQHLTMRELYELQDRLEPIIEEYDCDLIVTNRPVVPVGKESVKEYLKSLIESLK